MALVVAAWGLWALDPIIIDVIGAEVPRLFLTGWSYLFAGLTLAPWIPGALGHVRALSARMVTLLIVQVLFFSIGADFSYSFAIRYLNPGLVVVVMRTQVALSVIGGWFIFGERLSRKSILGIGMIVLANAVMGTSKVLGASGAQTQTQFVLGMALIGWLSAVASAFLWAGGPLSSKALLGPLPPFALAAVRLSASGILAIALSIALEGTSPYGALDGRQWLMMTLRGSLALAVAYVIYYSGLARVPVYVAASLEPFSPLFTILIAACYRPGETVSFADQIGVVVLLVGAAVAVSGSRPPPHEGARHGETALAPCSCPVSSPPD